MSTDIPGPATHPDTGGELWHYEWNGWMWCEREAEAFDWPDSDTACPHCGKHITVPLP